MHVYQISYIPPGDGGFSKNNVLNSPSQIKNVLSPVSQYLSHLFHTLSQGISRLSHPYPNVFHILIHIMWITCMTDTVYRCQILKDNKDICQTRTVISTILRPHFHSFIYKANYYQPVSLYLSILTLADLCTGRHIFFRCHKCQITFCVFRAQ